MCQTSRHGCVITSKARHNAAIGRRPALITRPASARHSRVGVDQPVEGVGAAYDEKILGISPDYVVHINPQVLIEVDGPMLKYGLQEMDRRNLWLPTRPKDRPDQDRLAARFDEFKRVA